ncbi:MAG TPA: hypothetical protein VGP33_03140, partial [Chloroflexota bacterium]|nr:hypothetical protein [Chloroflexota bacterium]
MADEPTRGLQAWPLAKTSPPRPRTLITRGRLLEPLNASTVAGRVTLVVAPGGSGKTSLLSDWARQAPMPVAWYTLDAADRDMGRMVAGICAAIERVRPGSTDLARRALEHGSTETAAIGMLLGSLEDVPLTLVLDDFHHLDDLPEATALWEHLFRFRPSCVALVILSRSVPLLGFAMLAAMDALLGLGRTELSFDADEAARLLDAHGLDSRSAAHFVVRSDGWATGVLLLARAAPGGVRFLHARTDALMDQLGSEVLAALPDDLREFLLESATLGPATSDEANAILGRQDSLAYYAEVAARGLFVVHEGGVYRYHDLFADYFVSVLKMEQPERLRAIRERASEWWVEHDDVPRALGLLADDDDWPALAGMLERE